MLINWTTITNRCPNITGIIHVGAYLAEERKVYGNIPTKWVEADPELYAELKAKGLDVYHFAATDYTGGTAMLNICPFRPANSLLEPNLNKRRSDVRVIDTIEVPADRIETIQEPGYNFIAMDIQGGELNALKGLNFDTVDYLLLELHKVETYVNVPLVDEIDYYLESKGYKRVLTAWTKHGWGDGLYVKNELVNYDISI